MKKAVVLSSGGLDSTTCLALAVHNVGAENVTSLAFKYGQVHSKELEASQAVSDYYKVEHIVLDIASIFQYNHTCSLLQHTDSQIPEESYVQQISESSNGQLSTYVPFRNGLMLSCAASVAMSLYPEDEVELYLGAHADDAAGNAYPDCSVSFIFRMAGALNEGTYHKITLYTPFMDMTKSDVVRTGTKLDVPYHLTWSCYQGGDKPCGKCGTCRDRLKAFRSNNLIDPWYTYNNMEEPKDDE